jgi:hypothetical protein
MAWCVILLEDFSIMRKANDTIQQQILFEGLYVFPRFHGTIDNNQGNRATATRNASLKKGSSMKCSMTDSMLICDRFIQFTTHARQNTSRLRKSPDKNTKMLQQYENIYLKNSLGL